jgi:hypothetical protein
VAIIKGLTSADPAVVGETVTFRFTLTISGDTTVTEVGLLDTFENKYLRYVGASPSGCVLVPNFPDRRHDAIACDVGAVTPGTAGNPGTVEFTYDVAFEAVASTLPGRTVNEVIARLDPDGAGPASATTIGPASADIAIVDVLSLQLPPAGDGSAQADGTTAMPLAALTLVLLSGVVAVAARRALLPLRSRRR